MSSPPAIDYPSDDVDVDMDVDMDTADNDQQQEQSLINAPPADPLFQAGAQSPSTPRRRAAAASSTPMGSAVARRALGMAVTPKKTPLFFSSSSPLAYPSSSPAKNPNPVTPRKRGGVNSDFGADDSEPLDFPS